MGKRKSEKRDLGRLLAGYAYLMNSCGVRSREALDFLRKHAGDREFLELAEVSRQLKESLVGRKKGRDDE